VKTKGRDERIDIFDGVMRSVSPYKKRKRFRVWILRLTGALIFALFVFLAGRSGHLGDGLSAALGGNKNETETQSNKEIHTEIESETDRLEDEHESEERTEISETEGETITPIRLLSDMSQAEMGDGYVVNLTDWRPDTERLLKNGLGGGKSEFGNAPIVLILHTRTSEFYADALPDSPSDTYCKGVVGIGESICLELNARGIPTVHCTAIHDGDPNADPYVEAADSIKHAFEVYPTLKYVIDIQRLGRADDGGELIKNGSSTLKGSAQIRVSVSSMGRFPVEDLTVALCLRRELNSYGKRLCMPVVITDGNFSGEITWHYLKVDIGGAGNNFSESERAGRYFAEALAEILKK
jgi:stage II sporulation protein P